MSLARALPLSRQTAESNANQYSSGWRHKLREPRLNKEQNEEQIYRLCDLCWKAKFSWWHWASRCDFQCDLIRTTAQQGKERTEPPRENCNGGISIDDYVQSICKGKMSGRITQSFLIAIQRYTLWCAWFQLQSLDNCGFKRRGVFYSLVL